MKIGDPLNVKGIRFERPTGESGARQQEGVVRLALAPGQLVKGRVAGFTPEGRVLLEIGGQTIEARAEVELRPGSSFWLEVKQGEPLPWLGLAAKKGAAFEFMQQFLSDPAALGRGLRALASLAFQSGSGAAMAEQAAFLQEFARTAVGEKGDVGQVLRLLSLLSGTRPASSGGEAGATLHDRLGSLLTLLRHESGLGMGKENVASLEKLLTLLDLQHELNSLPSPANQGQYFLFPCLLALGAGSGQWLFTMDQEGDGGAGREASYTLRFFLEMSRLGEVQVQVAVRGKALHGDIVVGGEKVREHLAGQVGELEEILAGLGFGPVGFSCRVGKTGLLQGLKAALEEAAQLAPVRILDVQA